MLINIYKIKYNLQYIFNNIVWQPLGFALTIFVISLVMTLSTVNYLLWKNTNTIEQQIYSDVNIILFLDKNISQSQIQQLKNKLNQDIGNARYISPTEGMEQFKKWADLDDIIDSLENNPIPPTIEIYIANKSSLQTKEIKKLYDKLIKLSGVKEVQLPTNAIDKITIVHNVITNILYFLVLLVVVTIFLVISNNIRNEIVQKKQNIIITKDLGATDHFISIPFIFLGMFYGCFGAILSCFFTDVLFRQLQENIQQLSGVLGFAFKLQNVTFIEICAIIIMGTFLGWLSSTIAFLSTFKLTEFK